MRNITPEDHLPIWQKEALFPEKPPQTPYGYVLYTGSPVPAHSLKELKQRFSTEEGKVYGVWRPERKRVIPVAEAPELLQELKPKRLQEAAEKLKSTRTFFLISLGILIFFLFPAFRQMGWQFYTYPMVGMATIMAVIFGFQPFYDAHKSHKKASLLCAETLKEEAMERRFDMWISRQKAPFTKALTFLLVGFSILQIMVGGDQGFTVSTKSAGLLHKSLLNGETWRLWTAPFLHGSLIHIFFNASALWHLGKRVEVLAKWAHFLMVFISSAIIGSFCSIHFLPVLPNGVGVNGIGASGGIMGLLGFLLTFELLHPKLTPKPAKRRLIAAIGMMFVIGFIGIAFIDNAAHLGGLLAGALYAYLTFSKSESAKRPRLQRSDWIIGIGSLLLIIWSILLTYNKIT